MLTVPQRFELSRMTRSNSQQRALILEPSGNLWGSERVLLDFLQVAAQSSWQIAVCCPPRTPILESLGALKVEVFPTFTANLHLQGRKQRFGALVNLLRAARKFRPNLIYVNQAGATRIALAVGRMLRIPVVTHVRLAEDVEYVTSLGAGERALPKVLCISHIIREMFEAQNAVSEAQLEMLYDPYAFRAEEASAASEILPGEAPVFSCVGRLAHIKGQDVLLRALTALQSEGIEARVYFVGAPGPGDEFGDELKRLANELGVDKRVVWAGFQKQALSHLGRCAAQVCPSRGEPLGRVVFEAWDAGILPVAWAGSGGPAEVIRQSGGGLLYEEQAGEDLARSLKMALNMNVEQKSEMIERGRAWLRNNCDPARYTMQMLAWWQEVVKAP